MSCMLRAPTVDELPALSALCLRSKAVWGYDAEFIEACRRELAILPGDLEATSIIVAEDEGQIVGVAQFRMNASEAELLKLFVEPAALRGGVGQKLFLWAAEQATTQGADRMVIEADPDAVPFYRRMGAEDDGLVPSGSIPGRLLPRLVKQLRSA
jgi:GNAT superfamily N-acetyltransferase